MAGHRKTVKHYHEPGDCHELTFSCYRRMPLLTNDDWRKKLCVAIDRALEGHNFRLVNAINYIHGNPVRRGLVQRARDWKWSSARRHESDGQDIDPDLPALHGLPYEFFI